MLPNLTEGWRLSAGKYENRKVRLKKEGNNSFILLLYSKEHFLDINLVNLPLSLYC